MTICCCVWPVATCTRARCRGPADAPAAGDVDTVELGTALPDDALGQGETIDIIWRLYDAALEPVKARIIAVEPVNERRFKFTAIDEVAAYTRSRPAI